MAARSGCSSCSAGSAGPDASRFAIRGPTFASRPTWNPAGHGSYGTRLYLCEPENGTHVKRVLFRDWLRVHPANAAEYAALKRRLAAEANGEWKFYTGGKAEFVARIVRQATA